MRVKNLLKALPIGIILSSFCFAAYASSELDAIMKARGLSEKDILAAAKTYQPSGRKDEYLLPGDRVDSAVGDHQEQEYI